MQSDGKMIKYCILYINTFVSVPLRPLANEGSLQIYCYCSTPEPLVPPKFCFGRAFLNMDQSCEVLSVFICDLTNPCFTRLQFLGLLFPDLNKNKSKKNSDHYSLSLYPIRI